MFHRGVLIAVISAVALFFVALFVGIVAVVLYPITITVLVLYGIAWIYTGRQYSNAYIQLNTPAVFSTLIQQLDTDPPAAQSTADDTLALLSPDSLPALERVLLEGRDPERQQIARTLVKIGDPAVETLVRALNDPKASVRLEALLALGQMQNSRSIVPLTTLLVDTDPRIRGTAAEFLGTFGDHRAVEPLIQALDLHDDQLTVGVAHALGNLGDQRAIWPLTQLRDNDIDGPVRVAAIEALKRLGVAQGEAGVTRIPAQVEAPTVTRIPAQVEAPTVTRIPAQVEAPTVTRIPAQVEAPTVTRIPAQIDDNGFEAWILSLPFPVASILRAYDADEDVKEKLGHLLDFYEGLSIFVATLMLSELTSDNKAWEQEFAPRLYKESIGIFDPPTFMSWVILGQRLASIFRKKRHDTSKWNHYREIFGSPQDAFIDLVSEHELYDMLEEAVKIRNNLAHGGALGDEQAHECLSKLEDYLRQLRQLMSDKLKTCLIVAPLSSEYREEMYHYKVKKLVGPYTTFKEGPVETVGPMDSRKLYVLHAGSQVPVELLPFFKIIQAPKTKQDACYFYNRFDKKENKVRWVSYYYEKESAVSESDDRMDYARSLLEVPKTAV
jgi:hypothetical protein